MAACRLTAPVLSTKTDEEDKQTAVLPITHAPARSPIVREAEKGGGRERERDRDRDRETETERETESERESLGREGEIGRGRELELE